MVGSRDVHFIENAVGVIQPWLTGSGEFYAAARAVEKTEFRPVCKGVDRVADPCRR